MRGKRGDTCLVVLEVPDEDVGEAKAEAMDELEDLLGFAPEAEPVPPAAVPVPPAVAPVPPAAAPVLLAAAPVDVGELAFLVEPEEEDEDIADELDPALSDADELGGAPQNV